MLTMMVVGTTSLTPLAKDQPETLKISFQTKAGILIELIFQVLPNLKQLLEELRYPATPFYFRNIA